MERDLDVAEQLAELEVELEEVMESGDLEDQLELSMRVGEMQARVHLEKFSRSVRAAVRNPVLALPAIAQLQALDPAAKAALAAVLGDIKADARERADKCWRTHKAPMAAYWKAVSVYAGHIRRAINT